MAKRCQEHEHGLQDKIRANRDAVSTYARGYLCFNI